jgi:hypothetical protein
MDEIAAFNERARFRSLLAEIEYRAKSAEGKVRHPFKGIRGTYELGLGSAFGLRVAVYLPGF